MFFTVGRAGAFAGLDETSIENAITPHVITASATTGSTLTSLFAIPLMSTNANIVYSTQNNYLNPTQKEQLPVRFERHGGVLDCYECVGELLISRKIKFLTKNNFPRLTNPRISRICFPKSPRFEDRGSRSFPSPKTYVRTGYRTLARI